MTAPFSGFKYKSGSDLGEFAKAAAGFAKGSRAETDRRRKKALDDALLALKERENERQDKELKLRGDEFEVNKSKEAQRIMEHAGNEDQELEQFNREGERFKIDDAFRDRQQTETEKNNREDNATNRSRYGSNGGAKPQLRQTENGFEWFYPPTAGTASTVPVLGADGTPKEGVPTQGERGAKSDMDLIQENFDTLKTNMAAVGNEPPGILTQVGLDATQLTGKGPISSLARSLANKGVGKLAPGYQKIQNSIQAITADVGRLKSGLVLNEQEAQRIINLITPIAGDTDPGIVEQKMQQVQSILDAAKLRAGRANSTPAATAAPQRPDVADIKKKYNLE